jgi:hypothetical protein
MIRAVGKRKLGHSKTWQDFVDVDAACDPESNDHS